MVEEPAQEATCLDPNEDIVAPAPAYARVISDETRAYHWRNAGAWNAEEVAKGVACKAVFHGDEFTHDVEVGELGCGGYAHDRCANDQRSDIMGNGADYGSEDAESGAAHEDPASTKDVGHSTGDCESNS